MNNNKSDFMWLDGFSGKKEIEIRKEEKKTILLTLLGNKNCDASICIDIRGSGARVDILGIIIGSANQKIKFHTEQIHTKGGSMSNLLIRSVLFDKSRLDYSGLIRIEKDAQKSDAYQKNQNIIMSSDAWAESKPFLEILANDVKCTHGATIGKIDKEKLYYLNTRGICVRQAELLILEGFLKEVLDKIPDPKVSDNLMQSVNLHLSQNLYV
jgi:Fe-S cluster assembly protein SufD